MKVSRRLTVKIDTAEPNVFPTVDRNVEVILATTIEGQFTAVTIKLSYDQANDLAILLEPFRNS